MATDSSNLLINYVLSLLLKKIVVPGNYHAQCQAVREMQSDDVSGLVDSLTDFACNSANVDFSIETSSSEYTRILKKWLDEINKDYRGKLPSGIQFIAEQYFRERWKQSSFPVLKIMNWENVNGLILPTKMSFVDGESIYANDKDKEDVIKIDNYDYFITDKFDPKHKLDANCIFSRPYGRYFDKYPIPYLIKRGIYHNWKIIQSIKNKETEILDQIIPYILLIKKGFKGNTIDESKTYSSEELKSVVAQFQDLMNTLKSTNVDDKQIKSPIRASNFDEEIKHLIPDLGTIFEPKLFAVAEKSILAGLGFLDIAEGVSQSIDKTEKVFIKYNNIIKNIKVEKLDNELQKSDKLQVPTYEKGKVEWKKAKLWKHPYKGKMYHIFTNEGKYNIKTTENHSVMVWQDGQLISKRADELKRGDILLVLDKFPESKKYQNIKYYNVFGSNQNAKKRKEENIIIDEDIGYFLGFYLAEGCTTKYSVIVDNTDKTIIDNLENIILSKTSKIPSIYKRISRYSGYKPCYHFQIHSRGLVDWFRQNFNTNAHSKEIPNVIFNSPKSVQKAFLKGYLDGDGHLLKRDNIWTSSTASQDLAKDLMLLAKMLGYNPYLQIQARRHEKHSNSYIIRYTNNIGRIPNSIVPKRRIGNGGYLKNGKELKDFYNNLPNDWILKKIMQIETYDYNDMVYDLEVDDNPTFVAGTGILVHNSRKESILNPKLFIAETKKGVKDFKGILKELLLLIKDKNETHTKYNNVETHVISSPVTVFASDDFKEKIRQLYDRGRISSQTAVEIIAEVDFRTEVMRRQKEEQDGISEKMFPVVTKNIEGTGFDLPNEEIETQDKNDKELPDDKVDEIEKQEYNLGKTKYACECIKCGHKMTSVVHCKDYKCSKCGGSMRRVGRPGSGRPDKSPNAKADLVGAPYPTITSLPDYIKKKYDKTGQNKWRRIWNSAYKYMLKKTGNAKKAEAYAFRVANSKMRLKVKSKGNK